MNQSDFENQHQATWRSLEHLLQKTASRWRPRQKKQADDLTADDKAKKVTPEQLPFLYAQTCHHLAIAGTRHYSPGLIARLQQLTTLAHNRLYAAKPFSWRRLTRFVTHVFPRAVRRHAALMWLSALLFLGSMCVMGTISYFVPDTIYTVMSDAQVAGIEYMYDPSTRRVGRDVERQADTDLLMFGFYTYNNTSIGFRTYAGGLLFGVGSAFFLLFNGVFIGCIGGYLTQRGFTETFWPFVSGHSAFELTAIVLSGGAGLLLAKALIAPGINTRMQALRRAALQSVTIISGAALMFFAAAAVEAFWSSNLAIPSTVKYVAGIALWILTLAYLTLAGRSDDAA